MPRFAANLSFLFDELPFLERFAAATAAGFSGVEFLFPYAHPAAELADRLRAHGLRQALFNLPPGDWNAGERGLAALPDRRTEFQDSVASALAYARALDCPTLHAMAGLVPEGADRETLRETYIDNLRFAADACAADGISVVIEPLNDRDVPGYFLAHVDEAAAIVAAVDRPNVGLQFDCYHVQIMDGDLARRIERHRALIRHVQIAGVPGRHEPDVGEIHYPYLFDLLDRLGYTGWVGCEYRPAATTVAGLGWLTARPGRAAAT
jgi:hydroxypyruvate isomerase